MNLFHTKKYFADAEFSLLGPGLFIRTRSIAFDRIEHRTTQ